MFCSNTCILFDYTVGAGMFGYYIDAFRRCADFKGCSTRAEYWWFALINFLIRLAYGIMFYFAVRSVLVDVITSNLNAAMEAALDADLNGATPQIVTPQITPEAIVAAVYARMRFWSILSILYNLIVFIPGLALFARRLHDAGHSAWHVLFFWLQGVFAAIAGLILSLSVGGLGFFSIVLLGVLIIGIIAYDLTLLVWLCTPSKIKDNPYRGSDSEPRSNEEVFVSREVEKTERMKAIDDFFKSPLK